MVEKRRPPRGGRGLKFKILGKEVKEMIGRPPRGGRGLKYYYFLSARLADRSPSPRRAWIEILNLKSSQMDT